MVGIGQLLDLLEGAALVVLADELVLEEFLSPSFGIAAEVTIETR